MGLSDPMPTQDTLSQLAQINWHEGRDPLYGMQRMQSELRIWGGGDPPDRPRRMTLPSSEWRCVNSAVSPRQEEAQVRGLYEVFALDPETEAKASALVIASGPENARVKMILHVRGLATLPDATTQQQVIAGLDPDDLDILVRRVGDVRPKAGGA